MEAAQSHVQPAPEYLQGWRLRNPSGKPAPVFEYSHDDYFFFSLMFK